MSKSSDGRLWTTEEVKDHAQAYINEFVLAVEGRISKKWKDHGHPVGKKELEGWILEAILKEV